MATRSRCSRRCGPDRQGHAVAAVTVSRSIVVLAVPVAVAALLRLWALADVGFGNQYYAATVKSMTTSLGAFLYGSFDPELFLTVDKPAPGLWPQALAAAIFGISPLALLLPQAIAGIASVAVFAGPVLIYGGG